MTKKSKIDWVFVLPLNSKNGAEQIIHYMVDYLLKQGSKCQIIFLFRKNYDYWDNLGDSCEVIYLHTKSVYLGYFLLIKKLYLLFKYNDVKYVFSSQTLINGLLGLLKKNRIIKNSILIVRESTSIFKRFSGIKLFIYKTAYVLGYSSVDLIICQTEFMKKQLVDSLPNLLKNQKNQIIVLPNPINLEEVKENSIFKLNGVTSKDFIVTAGRLIPEKGFDILIKSFKKLKSRIGSIKLLILGKGPEEMKLMHLIDELELNDEVILFGHVKNVFPFFKKAKLCVVSSNIEGFPNVLLQMMSQNNKVVSTLCAGGLGDIKGLKTCKPSDSKELSISIKKCLDEDSYANRLLFDEFLEKRSVSNYFKMLMQAINSSENK